MSARDVLAKSFPSEAQRNRTLREYEARHKAYRDQQLRDINDKLKNLIAYEQNPIGPFPKGSAYGLEKASFFPKWDEKGWDDNSSVLFKTVRYFLEKWQEILKNRASIAKIHNTRAKKIMYSLLTDYGELFGPEEHIICSIEQLSQKTLPEIMTVVSQVKDYVGFLKKDAIKQSAKARGAVFQETEEVQNMVRGTMRAWEETIEVNYLDFKQDLEERLQRRIQTKQVVVEAILQDIRDNQNVDWLIDNMEFATRTSYTGIEPYCEYTGVGHIFFYKLSPKYYQKFLRRHRRKARKRTRGGAGAGAKKMARGAGARKVARGASASRPQPMPTELQQLLDNLNEVVTREEIVKFAYRAVQIIRASNGSIDLFISRIPENRSVIIKILTRLKDHDGDFNKDVVDEQYEMLYPSNRTMGDDDDYYRPKL